MKPYLLLLLGLLGAQSARAYNSGLDITPPPQVEYLEPLEASFDLSVSLGRKMLLICATASTKDSLIEKPTQLSFDDPNDPNNEHTLVGYGSNIISSHSTTGTIGIKPKLWIGLSGTLYYPEYNDPIKAKRLRRAAKEMGCYDATGISWARDIGKLMDELIAKSGQPMPNLIFPRYYS